MFFTASVLPVVVGTVAGAKLIGIFDGTAFAFALASVVCVHASVNVFNDVFDADSGADRANAERIHPFTGGSRFIQNGVMSGNEMAVFAFALLGAGSLLGAVLFALKGPAVLLFGAIGIGLGILYSMPPVQLAGRGLGEIAVGIGLGVLPVMGSAWLQAGALSGQALLLSLPLGCWIAAVLIANEVPDAAADAAAGKRTLAVRLGAHGIKVLYFAVQAAAAVSLAIGMWLGRLPAWGLGLPAAMLAAAGLAAAGLNVDRASLVRAIKLTLAIHLAGGLWLALLAAAV
ncbi:MAG: prenyltransferase [Rhodospirillales bacterium]|nr:prenyltransferase [Rhodospirillales bacterium]